jgi:hypothetical protein
VRLGSPSAALPNDVTCGRLPIILITLSLPMEVDATAGGAAPPRAPLQSVMMFQELCKRIHELLPQMLQQRARNPSIQVGVSAAASLHAMVRMTPG